MYTLYRNSLTILTNNKMKLWLGHLVFNFKNIKALGIGGYS